MASDALGTVARRDSLADEVSDVIAATLDIAAVATLLANESAQIREDTLDALVDNAADDDAQHPGLVARPELSIRAVRRVSGFVAASLLEILARRNDLDDATRRDRDQRVRQRLRDSSGPEGDAEVARTHEVTDAGLVDDEALQAAIDGGRRDFVVEVLARKTALEATTIDKVMRSGSAKAVTALAWRAGFSIRSAIQRTPPGRAALSGAR